MVSSLFAGILPSAIEGTDMPELLTRSVAA
jgi:hypothetical protein